MDLQEQINTNRTIMGLIASKYNNPDYPELTGTEAAYYRALEAQTRQAEAWLGAATRDRISLAREKPAS